MMSSSTERALLYLYTAAGHAGVAACEVGGAVWPDRELRGGRGVSHNGGGDYAAQMLLGRLKKAGFVEHASSEGSSRWRLSVKGLDEIRRLTSTCRGVPPMTKELAIHQITIGLGSEGFRAICMCGWQSEPSKERTITLQAGSGHKRSFMKKSQTSRPSPPSPSTSTCVGSPGVSTAMSSNHCPSCHTVLGAEPFGKSPHCAHCGWHLVTLTEWRALPPFQQGSVLYAQGSWPRSEIGDQTNPHPKGSAAWTAFRQGEQRAMLAAQDGEE